MSKELINFDTFNGDFGTVLAENEMFQDSSKHGKKCITELKDRLMEHVSMSFQLITKFQIKNCSFCPRTYALSPLIIREFTCKG